MTEYQDPFSTPQDNPIPSEHPSAASFRGRLILIEPTKYQQDLPKKDKPGQFEDKITATVTVIDGSGPVELMPQQVPSGQFVEGPEYTGVWFSQQRVVAALVNRQTKQPLKMMLGRLTTFKGGPAREGNPWGIEEPTEADKQVARDYLEKRNADRAAADVASATSGQATTNPWAKTKEAPF